MTATQPQTEHSPAPSSVEAHFVDVESMTGAGWSAFAKLIEPVMKHTADYTVQNVVDNVKSGDMQGWAIIDVDNKECVGAIATLLSIFESGLEVCTVVAAGTSNTRFRFEDWRGIIATIEHFALQNNCDIVRIAGRAGWTKVLPEYETSYVCIEKRVKEMDS